MVGRDHVDTKKICAGDTATLSISPKHLKEENVPKNGKIHRLYCYLNKGSQKNVDSYQPTHLSRLCDAGVQL